MTIGEALDLLAERDPSALAVDDGIERVDRAGLRDRSRRLARWLIDHGVEEGDLVTVRGGNTVATVVAVCAVWRAGATPQPLNPRLPEAEQAAVLDLARPRLVLDDLPDLTGVDAGPLPGLAAPSWKAPTSSGSTGAPKVVLAAAPARVDPDRASAPFLPLAATQLVVGPLTHSAPFTYAFRGLMSGHGLVLLQRPGPRVVLDAIAAHRVTWVLLVPSMLARILDARPTDLSSLETVLHLGSRIDPAMKRRVLALFGAERVTEVYAGSESNGLTVIRGDEWLEHPGSVGRPAAGTEVRVVGADGDPVPAGVTGRIELRRTAGPSYRYLGAETPPAGAWDTLGDDGHLDADGYLFLADRGADRIERHGDSFYPADVEHVLERHPAVRSALLAGVDGRVVAVAESEEDPASLREWANARLPAAQRIDWLTTTQDPLRDEAGKARRRDVLRRSG